jgi:acetoin utilization deacetylase AcuC-like enzyme
MLEDRRDKVDRNGRPCLFFFSGSPCGIFQTLSVLPVINIAFSDRYLYSLPEGHRFPIAKYSLVKEQLLHRGIITPEQLYDPGLCAPELILGVHTRDYWKKLSELSLTPKELRMIGLPLTELSVQRARNSVAGTVASTVRALGQGLGINIGGGTHHAFADHGEGFCILNDIAIAAQHLLDAYKLKQVLVIDLDVHQGNGTAAIFAKEPRVYTFSIHGKDNYPLRKELSDRDVALPSGTGDEAYLQILEQQLVELFEMLKPEFIFYQAGVDVLVSDKLGKLGLSKIGCRLRDEQVLQACRQQGVPVAISMGGGYSVRLSDVVDAHCHTIESALHIFQD